MFQVIPYGKWHSVAVRWCTMNSYTRLYLYFTLMLLLYLAKWNALLAVPQHQKGTKFQQQKQKSASAYYWVVYSSIVEVAIKGINASLTQNQCFQCVAPALTHGGIPRQRDATELNNDGMIKSSDVHYQSPTKFINFSERDLINDDSSFCSHILLAIIIDLQCHVFTFEKFLLNVRLCL